MGVDYSASIIVGLRRGDFDSTVFIENDELEVCAPYYDGNDDDNAIAGITIARTPDYSPAELHWDQKEVEQAMADFKRITGHDAKIWLSPHGW